MKILYLGNDLSAATGYTMAMDVLSSHLRSEGYFVTTYSQKKSIVLRFIDMIIGIIKNRNKTDVVLIDVYSTLNFYYSLIAALICRWLRLPFICILHGGNLPERLDRSKFLSQLHFKNANRLVAPSNYLKHEFEIRGYKVEYIPNTIPIDSYSFKERSLLRPRLLWVRAFAEIYNPIMAVKVLKLIKREYREATLCFIGPDRDGTRTLVEKFIMDQNLESSVEITGILSKSDWHKKSLDYDIFINTTNIDNTPVSVIEAMALGLYVVSTNVGGIPHLLKDNENAFLVNPDSEKEMATKILEILKNQSLFLTLNARKLAETFDWKYARQSWIELLNNTLK